MLKKVVQLSTKRPCFFSFQALPPPPFLPAFSLLPLPLIEK
jgi:hypothetical protein